MRILEAFLIWLHGKIEGLIYEESHLEPCQTIGELEDRLMSAEIRVERLEDERDSWREQYYERVGA